MACCLLHLFSGAVAFYVWFAWWLVLVYVVVWLLFDAWLFALVWFVMSLLTVGCCLVV